MFLCATSAQKDSNDAIDLTPAMFKNDLDEPIKVQNFEIELVSSIIRKDNIITIQSPENLLLFRLGTGESEAYTAEIPEGNYTVNELSTQIAKSLNDAVPCNAWRGWSVTTDANNKFTITFTPVTVPTNNLAIKENMVEAYGFQTTLSGTGGPAFRATLEANFSSDGLGNAGIETVENSSSYITHLADPTIVEGGSYFGIDSGNPLVEDFQQTKIDEAGIFESDGKCEFILRPVEVFQTSGIYAPATTVTDRYLTLEADVETTVYDPVAYPESFIQGEPMIRYEDDLGNLSNHSQRNGIYVEPGANNNANQRGLPYTRANHTLVFPSATDNNIDARKEAYRNTFGANMIFETSTTQPLPNRCFRIDPNETPAIKSESSLQFIGESKEKLSFRLSTSPLIVGLKNKDNGLITSSNILVPSGKSGVIQYIDDSEGIVNFRGFGMTTSNFENSLQGKLVTGDGRTIYKMPRYKIKGIDGNGQPVAVQLLDSGEHIGLSATANFGNMFLNDPSTFNILDPTVSDSTIVTDHTAQFNIVNATSLGNQAAVAATTTAFQWLPTEVSLVNDLIYQANRTLTETADVNNFSPPNKVNFSKDIAVKVVPLSVTATTGFVEFEITQFQPLRKTFNDDEEDIFESFALTGGDINERKLLLKCRPFTWNNFTGTGGYTAPTNWTSAWTAPTANHRIKISFEQEGIFATDIKVSFSTDGGTTFVEEQRLLQTGNKVTNVPPNSFQEMKQTIQPRLFPLHPCISMYPTKYRNDPAGSRPSEIGLIGSNYFNNSSYQKTNGVVLGIDGNYRKNLEFMTSGANQPDIFTFPPAAKLTPDQTKPQITLKTKSHPITIDDTTAFPLAVGAIRSSELPPNRGSLGNVIGLGSVYTAVAGFAAAGKIDFVGTSDATITPYVPSIAVEINNIPITGYIGKEYNLRDEQVGVGSRLPIVGVIPSLEQATAINKAQLAFRYNAPYSQPVVCKLPTEIFLYNISFRLREIQSGEIVKGLKHPTELIFRIKNLEDNDEKNNTM